jgi:hypothetical protein
MFHSPDRKKFHPPGKYIAARGLSLPVFSDEMGLIQYMPFHGLFKISLFNALI